jgi:hypothetical protein
MDALFERLHEAYFNDGRWYLKHFLMNDRTGNRHLNRLVPNLMLRN